MNRLSSEVEMFAWGLAAPAMYAFLFEGALGYKRPPFGRFARPTVCSMGRDSTSVCVCVCVGGTLLYLREQLKVSVLEKRTV